MRLHLRIYRDDQSREQERQRIMDELSDLISLCDVDSVRELLRLAFVVILDGEEESAAREIVGLRRRLYR